MSKIWKVVTVIAIVLAVLGMVLAAIGLFTGGSVDRMIEVLFGGRDTLDLMISIIKNEINNAFASIK